MISNMLPVNLAGLSLEMKTCTRNDVANWFLFVTVCYACMALVAGRYDSISKSSVVIRYESVLRYKMFFVRDISILIASIMLINLIISAIQVQNISFEMLFAIIVLLLNSLLKSFLLFWLMGIMKPTMATGICCFFETSILWHKGESLINIYNWGMLCRTQIYAKSGFHILYICMLEIIISVLLVKSRRIKR